MPHRMPDAAPCVLALDLGSKRIGLAVSDRERRIAFPAGVLERRGGRKDLTALRAVVAEREIGRIVVGLPIHMSGRRGPEAEAALAFAGKLAEATGLPVDTLDERWTTREAERALHEMGRPKSKQRGMVDTVAATILLRTYLARLEGEEARSRDPGDEARSRDPGEEARSQDPGEEARSRGAADLARAGGGGGPAEEPGGGAA